MCGLAAAAWASLAVSALSTATQYQQGKQTAADQEAMIKAGAAKDNEQMLRQYADQQAVTMEDTSQRHREAIIEEGRLKAIGAESGLQGISNDRIVADSNNQADRDIATLQANSLRAKEQIHSGGVAKQSQASAQMAGIRRPSSFGAGLQIAGAGLDAYAKTRPQETPSKDKP